MRRHLRLVLTGTALLLLAAASYALNQGAAAGGAARPGPVHVAGLDLSHGPDRAGLKPGEKIVLPNGVTVGLDAQHDLSPPLRDIPPAAAPAGHEAPENPYLFRALGHLADPIVQRFFGPRAMPTPSLTFEGLSAATSACACYPPDTNGAVGPNNYVQTTNVAFEIWNKSGTVLLPARTINTLFAGFGGACQTQNSGDPVVNYDRAADRWVISQFTSAAPYNQCVAVSQTGDPTGAYYRYAFLESATNLYDYPKLGVWPDAYYLTANVFQGNAFLNPAFLALDRSRMLQGLAATFQEVNPGNYYFAALPADRDSAAPPPAGAREPFLTLSGNNSALHLWNLHVDFSAPANTHLDGPTNLDAVPWDPNLCGLAPNCIPQPGVSASSYLDALADHTMFRLAYRNFGDHEALVTNESVNVGGNQAGIRWYEIRDPNGAPFIYQQGTYAPDSTSRWMGSAALDGDGNLAIGYSASSSSVYPSIRYTGRLAGDPLGQLGQGEATLFAGSGSQTGPANRWGDYSDLTVDPSDDCTFWYTNEYYPTTGATSWHTRVGRFKFASCGSTTPTPGPSATPRPAATSTPPPPPPSCATYSQSVGSGTLVPGTQDIGNHCDDCATNITLPFPVQIYGQTYTSAYAVSNGVLNFGGSDYPFGNACLPVPIFSHAVLAYWDDLTTLGPGLGIFSATSGSAPNRVYHLEWRAQVLTNHANLNVEIRLYETPPAGAASQVDIVYGTSVGQSGSGATIGLQGPGSAATQFECNTGGVVAHRALTYAQAPCPTAVPSSTPPSTATATATVLPSKTSTPGPSPTGTPPTATATPCPITFSDVPPSAYFYTPVQYLACHGVISGYADGTFRPYANTTRSQMVKIVVLGFAKPIQTPPAGGYTFTDVPPANPFYPYIETAAALNIVSGYTCGGPGEPCDGSNRPYFRPFANVTRGQLAKIDAIAAGWALLNPPARTFADVLPSSAFYAFVETAACHGVISGYTCGGVGESCDGQNRPYFRQGNPATRGQITKIVYLSILAPAACGP